MTTKLIIWDLDGTLVETQTLHAQAEAEVIGKFGIIIDPKSISKRFAGISTKEVFRILFEENNLEATEELLETCLKNKWKILYAIPDSGIKCVDGMYKLCEQLSIGIGKVQFKMNVASASPLEWIRKCLTATDLDRFFDLSIITSSEECKQGKPAPDVFLLAASRLHPNLGSKVIHTFGIDDGRAGVEGSIAAGFRTIWWRGETRIYSEHIGVYQTTTELVENEFPYLPVK